MTSTCSSSQQQQEQDKFFANLCQRLETASSTLSKQEKIRVARWIEKLEISGCSNIRWNRDRNEYARLLLTMVIDKKELTEPFHVLPSDGLLPRFPQHLSISTSKHKKIDRNITAFWHGIHSRIASQPRISSRSPPRERNDPGNRVKELEQALRNEKIQQSYQLQQLHAVHSAELSTIGIGTAMSLRSDIDGIMPRNTNSSASFFGSAVPPPSRQYRPSTSSIVETSSVAALIAATGIDDVLKSVHQDLESSSLSVKPPAKYQTHVSFSSSTRHEPGHLVSPKRAVDGYSPQRTSFVSENRPPTYLSFMEGQSGLLDDDERNSSTTIADTTNDEEFLAYVDDFQTKLEELHQSIPNPSRIFDEEYMNHLHG